MCQRLARHRHLGKRCVGHCPCGETLCDRGLEIAGKISGQTLRDFLDDAAPTELGEWSGEREIDFNVEPSGLTFSGKTEADLRARTRTALPIESLTAYNSGMDKILHRDLGLAGEIGGDRTEFQCEDAAQMIAGRSRLQ